MNIRVKFLTFMATMLIFSTLFVSTTVAAEGAGVTVKSNLHYEEGVTFEGQIIDGRTNVGFFGLMSCLPYLVYSKAVSFNDEEKILKIFSDDYATDLIPRLQFRVGDDFFYAGTEKVSMDTKIQLIDNRISIPIKAVVAYYNLNISYDQKTRVTSITK